jgi:hypothetical protein
VKLQSVQRSVFSVQECSVPGFDQMTQAAGGGAYMKLHFSFAIANWQFTIGNYFDGHFKNCELLTVNRQL